jgi:ABC-2 type transport system permease protein
MKDLIVAVEVEGIKLLKSKVLWIVLGFFIFIPTMMGSLLLLVKHPELADKMGIISTTKANMIGNADWPTMFMLMGQIISIGGVFGFGFITSWVFGREYSEKTLKDMLALPISRTTFVLAKFTVISACSLVLSIIMFITSILIGTLVGLGDLSFKTMMLEFFWFESSAIFLIALSTPVAYFANVGRGYLLPLGGLIIVVIFAQFIGVLGLAPYFPWAVPALFLEEMHGTEAGLTLASYVILLLTTAIGLYVTNYWWNKVDQT